MIHLRTLTLFVLFCRWGMISMASPVSGYVRDPAGEVLPFATLYVRETEFGTTTNLEGYFEFDLPPGNYNPIIQYLGYETKTARITVTDQPLKLNFLL